MSAFSGPQHRGARRLRKGIKREEAYARNAAYRERLAQETPEGRLLTEVFAEPTKKKRQRSRSHKRAG